MSDKICTAAIGVGVLVFTAGFYLAFGAPALLMVGGAIIAGVATVMQ